MLMDLAQFGLLILGGTILYYVVALILLARVSHWAHATYEHVEHTNRLIAEQTAKTHLTNRLLANLIHLQQQALGTTPKDEPFETE